MFALYDWFGYKLATKERYRLIKKAGFDAVLLWWGAYLDRKDYRNDPQAACEAGLVIENIHAPFQLQDDIWQDDLCGEAAFACYMQCVADCAAFEIPTVVVHLPDDDKPCNALGLSRIMRLAERAERLDVNIALENLANIKNLSYMLEHVNSAHIGFCYDCCHHVRNDPQIDLLALFGSRMMALHLHDYREDAIHRLPFDGEIDWAATMQRIARAGYAGSIAIEAMNWGYQDLSATEFVSKAFQSAQRLEALCATAR